MFRMRLARLAIVASFALSALCASPSVRAEDPKTDDTAESVSAPGGEFLDSLWSALSGGNAIFDLRARVEIVEEDELDTGRAYTERIRLGYETGSLHGFSVLVELEDIRTIDDDRYNAADLNDNPGKASVADPQDTELNRGFLKYQNDYGSAVFGRQRLILDDHRFVGNVGWRQNEQTFDAFTLSSDAIPQTTLLYSYVVDVNRIFGPDSGRDFESDSHLLNASWNGCPFVSVTGFAYRLDFDNAPANSSNTVGLRLTGEHELCEQASTTYAFSYAYQGDAADNPNSYDANYLFLESAVNVKEYGTAGIGYELLGSDDSTFAFQTPLATLHKFNGWADVFLMTPDEGLQDLYLKAGTQLPYEIDLQAFFHWFWTDDTDVDLGNELDVVAKKKITENVAALVKAAFFDGRGGLADRQKYWLQVEVKF